MILQCEVLQAPSDSPDMETYNLTKVKLLLITSLLVIKTKVPYLSPGLMAGCSVQSTQTPEPFDTAPHALSRASAAITTALPPHSRTVLLDKIQSSTC